MIGWNISPPTTPCIGGPPSSQGRAYCRRRWPCCARCACCACCGCCLAARQAGLWRGHAARWHATEQYFACSLGKAAVACWHSMASGDIMSCCMSCCMMQPNSHSDCLHAKTALRQPVHAGPHQVDPSYLLACRAPAESRDGNTKAMSAHPPCLFHLNSRACLIALAKCTEVNVTQERLQFKYLPAHAQRLLAAAVTAPRIAMRRLRLRHPPLHVSALSSKARDLEGVGPVLQDEKGSR